EYKHGDQGKQVQRFLVFPYISCKSFRKEPMQRQPIPGFPRTKHVLPPPFYFYTFPSNNRPGVPAILSVVRPQRFHTKRDRCRARIPPPLCRNIFAIFPW